MGVVAHFYMDVELQGILQAVARKDALKRISENNASSRQAGSSMTELDDELTLIQTKDINSLNSRIAIADSLAMGDHALRMCRESNIKALACLGVDFMAESVAAILEQNGYGHIPVYRARSSPIGCSLAESAERLEYRAWLESAKRNTKGPALHVVYINTSLETKAISNSIIPTITCTSSNVLKTILQASAQIGPNLQIYYGPDTYMGDNLVSMLDGIIGQVDRGSGRYHWDDDRIAKELHPAHTRDSLRMLRDGMNVYPHGNCVVHHMFGADVVETVRTEYEDAFVTAHLEVPGEMFQIAMEKSLSGKGTVGSTSDILNFISQKVGDAARAERRRIPSGGGRAYAFNRLQFILGTEAGMVTSIVRSVQGILSQQGSKNVEAEIVFPVASEAITAVDDHSELAIVPGVSGGEGCSTAGGCATCPFMKMNDLDALSDIIDMVQDSSEATALRLQGHLPPQRLRSKWLNGRKAVDLGVQPIHYMRRFMKEAELPHELVSRIVSSNR